MPKMHTRRKRRLAMLSHLNGNKMLKLKKRPQGARTFKTEEAAKKYAQEHQITTFNLVNLRGPFSQDKKLKIVPIEK